MGSTLSYDTLALYYIQYHCGSVGGSWMECRMAEGYLSLPIVCSFSWILATGGDPAWTFLGRTEQPTCWRWTVLLGSAQLGLGALGELQLRSRRANGRPHTSFLSPVPSSGGGGGGGGGNIESGGYRRWHYRLASNYSTQHLMTQNRPIRRRVESERKMKATEIRMLRMICSKTLSEK